MTRDAVNQMALTIDDDLLDHAVWETSVAESASHSGIDLMTLNDLQEIGTKV